MGRKRTKPLKFQFELNEIIYYIGGLREGYHNEPAKVLRRSTPKGNISYKLEFLKDGKVTIIQERFLRKLEEMELEKEVEKEEIKAE